MGIDFNGYMRKPSGFHCVGFDEVWAEAVAQAQAMGLGCPDFPADGNVQRFPLPEDRAGKKTGWGVAWSDGVPTVLLSSWKLDEPIKVSGNDECFRGRATARSISKEEIEANKRRMAEARKKREADRKAAQDRAAEKARATWECAAPATADHPYLKRKGILDASGLRTVRSKHPVTGDEEDALLAPLINARSELRNLQFIYGDGTKRYQWQAERKGTFLMLHADKLGNGLFLCEGAVTGKSIAEAAGGDQAVACVCDCGNYEAVLEGLQAAGKYDASKAAIIYDNDSETAQSLYADAMARGKAAGKTAADFNPGRKAALAAAGKFGCRAVAAVPDGCTYPDGAPASDANDLFMAKLQECLATMNPAEAREKALETVRTMLQAGVQAPALTPPMPFMSRSEAADLPTLSYIVKGLVPSKGIGQLFGPPACAKTFILLTLCHHISEGWDFHGRRVHRRPVYYLLLEGAGGLSKRLQAFNAWLNEEKRPPLTGDLRFSTAEFSITDDAHINSLIAAVRQAGHRGAVIVIDTQSQATVGLDENAAKDMGVVIRNARRIASAVEGVVILVHHTGKNKELGARGSNTQLGNMDFMLEVEKSGKGYITLKTAKEKDESDDQELNFRLKVYEVGTDDDGDPITSCVAVQDASPASLRGTKGGKRLSPATRTAWKALETVLQGLDGMAIHRDVWRDEFLRIYIGGKDEKSKSAEFYRQAKRMAAEEWIVVDGDMVSFPSSDLPNQR